MGCSRKPDLLNRNFEGIINKEKEEKPSNQSIQYIVNILNSSKHLCIDLDMDKYVSYHVLKYIYFLNI